MVKTMTVNRETNYSNLLLITFDQCRGDWGGEVGPDSKLINIRAVQENAIVLERCYTNSPQCIPARMSWLTGLQPSQLGVTKNCRARLPRDAPSFARELQKSGWYTSLIGKTHWTEHNRPCNLEETKDQIRKLGFDQVREIAGPRALQHVE